MRIDKLQNVTIITVDDPRKSYLALKNTENSKQLIGKPVRMIFNNTGIVPEFEEREVNE
jgi:hypothetical protein